MNVAVFQQNFIYKNKQLDVVAPGHNLKEGTFLIEYVTYARFFPYTHDITTGGSLTSRLKQVAIF